MRLTDIFSSDRNIQNNGTGSISMPQTNSQVALKILQSLMPGETINGEVVSKNGSDILLKLMDNTTINAKLSEGTDLAVGKNVTFEVKSSAGGVTLSPLFTNTAAGDANILKALDMAGIPVNDRSVAMTDGMMKNAMPIDINSLQSMYTKVVKYNDAEVMDLVDLQKMGMPVTEENINQISAYKNMNYKLTDGMNTIENEMLNIVKEGISSGNIENIEKFVQSLEVLANESEEEMLGEPSSHNSSENKVVISELPVKNENVNNDGKQSANIDIAGKEIVNDKQFISDVKPENENAGLKDVTLTNNVADRTVDKGNNEAGNAASKALELLNALAGKTEEIDNKPKAELDKNPLIKRFEEAFAKIRDKVTIKPEDVKDSQKVEDLYKKIDHELKGLTKSLENANLNNTTAYKATVNMNQNLDFLHELNQAYTYIQLPLKLSGGDTHGDLYVYTNKKNLAANDGEISALLHLDMEHLGPLDVYVKMAVEKVSTRFYVKDDETLVFLNDHMDILTERLNKRGYNITVSGQIKGEKELEAGGINKLLEQEDKQLISNYAFDMRA